MHFAYGHDLFKLSKTCKNDPVILATESLIPFGKSAREAGLAFLNEGA
jgi:hypothetical protein